MKRLESHTLQQHSMWHWSHLWRRGGKCANETQLMCACKCARCANAHDRLWSVHWPWRNKEMSEDAKGVLIPCNKKWHQFDWSTSIPRKGCEVHPSRSVQKKKRENHSLSVTLHYANRETKNAHSTWKIRCQVKDPVPKQSIKKAAECHRNFVALIGFIGQPLST